MNNLAQVEVEPYTEIRCLYSESFRSLFLARHKATGEIVAVKRIERGPKIDKYVANELRNHRMLKHPHIINFKEYYLTKKHLCIAMEYAAGGNLRDYINKWKGISLNTARWFFQQLIVGLDYCHKKGVADRDIKLENVLVEHNNEYPVLKICDFGYSKHEVLNSEPRSVVGTSYYMAPEVLMSGGEEIYDGMKADIWSCGVLLYAMVFNCFPFIKTEDIVAHGSIQKIVKRVCEGPLTFPTNNESTNDVRDLLTRILEKDPDHRITIDKIMEHPWFRLYLPDDAFEMNENLDSQKQESPNQNKQFEEEIMRIVELAKTPYNPEQD